MTRKVYEGLREMRAYCNAGWEAAELPCDETQTENVLAALAYFDWWLNKWGVTYDLGGSMNTTWEEA